MCENRTSRPACSLAEPEIVGPVPDGSASEGIGIVGDGRSALPCRPLLLLEDLAAKADALVADVDARPSDQPAYFALRLPTERAAQRAIDPLRGWRALEHEPSVFPFGANSHAPWAGPSNPDPPDGLFRSRQPGACSHGSLRSKKTGAPMVSASISFIISCICGGGSFCSPSRADCSEVK